MAKVRGAREKNQRVGLILAFAALLYIGAVIAFILAY
jgi:hypothetical protein